MKAADLLAVDAFSPVWTDQEHRVLSGGS